jgi:hypothetical protein
MTQSIPQTTMIERLEHAAGEAGTARARRMTSEHFKACRLAGVRPDVSRCVVYREALEMVLKGLDREEATCERDERRSYAQLYNTTAS